MSKRLTDREHYGQLLRDIAKRRQEHADAGRQLDAETAQTAREALDAGVPAVWVAEQVGISRTTLYKLLDRLADDD